MMKILIYLLLWLPLPLLAILNGLLRVKVYGPYMDELLAHQTSTVILMAVIGFYLWGAVRKWRPDSSQQAIVIGLMLVTLTVIFEFAFGRLVMHHTWERLIADYNIQAGRIWLLFLAWLGSAPWFFFRQYEE